MSAAHAGFVARPRPPVDWVSKQAAGRGWAAALLFRRHPNPYPLLRTHQICLFILKQDEVPMMPVHAETHRSMLSNDFEDESDWTMGAAAAPTQAQVRAAVRASDGLSRARLGAARCCRQACACRPLASRCATPAASPRRVQGEPDASSFLHVWQRPSGCFDSMESARNSMESVDLYLSE